MFSKNETQKRSKMKTIPQNDPLYNPYHFLSDILRQILLDTKEEGDSGVFEGVEQTFYNRFVFQSSQCQLGELLFLRFRPLFRFRSGCSGRSSRSRHAWCSSARDVCGFWTSHSLGCFPADRWSTFFALMVRGLSFFICSDGVCILGEQNIQYFTHARPQTTIKHVEARKRTKHLRPVS